MSTASLVRDLRRVRAAAAKHSRRPAPVPADRVEFAKACGIEPDPWQERVLRSGSRRLLLNCARQTGKTTIVAALALHLALTAPRSFALIFAPSLDQSLEFFRRVAEMMHGLGLEVVDPESLRKTGADLRNGSRIEARPGSERTARGRTADLLVIDEAARISDELYHSLRPMLIVSRGALVMLSTPYGKRGAYWEAWDGGVGWERHLVTANQCPRISPEDLEEERASLPARVFRQEYECEFVETEDQLFSHEDVAAALGDETVTPIFG